jgi:hypothetical protein
VSVHDRAGLRFEFASLGIAGEKLSRELLANLDEILPHISNEGMIDQLTVASVRHH